MKQLPSRSTTLRRCGLALAFAVGTLLGATAHAGNQDEVALGNEAALTGGAVTAVTGDTGAPWYNPAGMASLTGNTVDVSASAFVLKHRSIPDALQTQLPFLELSEDLSSLQVLSVPSALVFVRQLADGVTGGVGIFVPLQDQFTVTVSDAVQTTGRTGEEDGLFQQSFDLNFSRSRYAAGPSVGWAVTDRFRVGGSVFGIYESNSRESTFWSAGASANGRRLFVLGQRSSELTVLGAQAVGGLQWEFVRGFHAGVTARSPILVLDAWGDTEVLANRSLSNGRDDATVDVTRRSIEVGEDADFKILAPARFHAGVAADIGEGWISLEGDYALHNGESAVSPKLDPIWNVRAGARFPATESANFGLGVFTDRSGAKDPERVGEARVDFYGFAGGIELLTPYTIAGADDALVFSTTIGARYALGVGEAGGLRFTPLAQGPIANELTAEVLFHEVTLHLGSTLYF